MQQQKRLIVLFFLCSIQITSYVSHDFCKIYAFERITSNFSVYYVVIFQSNTERIAV